MTVVFFHGFLGVPDDWSFYAEHLRREGYEALALSLEDCEVDRVPEIIPRGAHLVGYSMGGRLALHYSSLKPDWFSSLTLISTNPGLLSEEEKRERILWEKEWLLKMETLSVEQFVREWYSQPAFLGFRPPARRFQQDKDSMVKIFRKFSIANLPPLWDHLLQSPCRVQMIFGGLDKKYMNLKRKIEEIDTDKRIVLKTILNRSHALHLNSPHFVLKQIAKTIRK